MRPASSGTTASQRICQADFSATFRSAGPPKSSYPPLLARSEIVIIPTEVVVLEFGSGGVMRSCFLSITPLLHYSITPFLRCSLLHFSFALLKQLDIGDLHPPVDCFAHIINRKECYGHTGERFHLHAGLRNGSRRALGLGAVPGSDQVDRDFAQRQRVAKRNELRRLF